MTRLVHAEGSELMAELFNRMPIADLQAVPPPIAHRIGDFLVANGYRMVFNRWYLQADPDAVERMNPMDSAPKDGTRILLKYVVMHYSSEHQWRADGVKWEECVWDASYSCSYPAVRGRWTPWCGNAHVKSTHTISEPLGWMPRPVD